ncbi:hypothetical protein EVAR_48392_1 [Eumeta japonica]|uniref:Uncharacterized protein n=1 Tax=Eumeta variegata TaxID=151549 RepID=A0A4C1ZEM6_EUMVA|nr:hypothetical protein EVAR_48392_1 [Eumeta japonica]
MVASSRRAAVADGCRGVIVYGMVTGALPFTAPERAGRAAGAGGDGRDRPQLRQMIARGLGRKQRAALTLVSPECNAFVSRLLEPRAEARMTVEEAACHGWLREGAAGRRLRAQPLAPLDRHATEEVRYPQNINMNYAAQQPSEFLT